MLVAIGLGLLAEVLRAGVVPGVHASAAGRCRPTPWRRGGLGRRGRRSLGSRGWARRRAEPGKCRRSGLWRRLDDGRGFVRAPFGSGALPLQGRAATAPDAATAAEGWRAQGDQFQLGERHGLQHLPARGRPTPASRRLPRTPLDFVVNRIAARTVAEAHASGAEAGARPEHAGRQGDPPPGQPGLQLGPAPRQAALERPEPPAEPVGGLLLGEPFEVTEDQGRAERLGQSAEFFMQFGAAFAGLDRPARVGPDRAPGLHLDPPSLPSPPPDGGRTSLGRDPDRDAVQPARDRGRVAGERAARRARTRKVAWGGVLGLVARRRGPGGRRGGPSPRAARPGCREGGLGRRPARLVGEPAEETWPSVRPAAVPSRKSVADVPEGGR